VSPGINKCLVFGCDLHRLRERIGVSLLFSMRVGDPQRSSTLVCSPNIIVQNETE